MRSEENHPPAVVTFGGPAPDLAEDLAVLRELPEAAKGGLWELIEANLGEPLGPNAQPTAERFAKAHGVPLERLIPLVRGARRLFRTAAQRDLSVDVVHKDLLALTGDPEITRRLTVCYGKAMPIVRAEAILASLQRFGPELVDVGLRMDHVSVSRHHPEQLLPIGMLSLRYREGGETHDVTLQVPPHRLKQLRDLLASVVK